MFPFRAHRFSATTVAFHSVGAFSFLSFLLLDVLMVRIVSNTIIKFNRVQKKKLHSIENALSSSECKNDLHLLPKFIG